MLEQVLKEIEQRERFVLTSHARPDGDAIGSVLACGEILRQMGKDAEVVLHDAVPQIYRPLPFAENVKKAEQVNGKFEAAILLECDSLQRTQIRGLDQHFLISIDHHATGKPFANVNWIEPSACATAEMIFWLAQQAGVKITPEIATCLYTAVLTDTGSFCFVGTNERTFALAQELVRAGADPARIAQSVYFSNTTAKMRLLGLALSHLHREKSVAWMHVTREQMDRVEARDEDCEGLVNYVLAIEGVEVAMFFREQTPQRWRVSLRSKGLVNVAEVATYFGGGGHHCASGCSLEGPLSVVTERVGAQLRIVAPSDSGVDKIMHWRT
ncbi:MAG TPA: bifunctional oligoribonuclease/PAP phosphatase NrnA [Terriglobales bacterium]|nr:bifunctional oligoribonuclease/PAP phosphatase NrnA [Terriglobales bacterium]